MADPLAEVIRGAIAGFHPIPHFYEVSEAVESAVRAHIAAVLDDVEGGGEVLCLSPGGRRRHPVIDNVRAALLGTVLFDRPNREGGRHG